MVIRGKYCVINGLIKPAEKFKTEFIKNGCSIYEVLRVLNGKPVFIEAHLDRLQGSAHLTAAEAPSFTAIQQGISQLIAANKIENGNIELVVNTADDWSVRFIPHYWPLPEAYENGVNTMLYKAMRENPNAKIKFTDLRAAVGAFIKQNSIYEAIYVSKNGCITEGSKSNVFFIINNTFYTAPDEQVLPGITRKVVLEILKTYKYPVEYRNVHIDELTDFDAAFITGTSPGVLPIAKINDYRYDVKQKELRNIMSLFETRLFST